MIDELVLIFQHLLAGYSAMDKLCLEDWEKFGVSEEWLE